MSRPSLYLTLLHRNLGEGHSWVEASNRALSGVAHAYDLVKQAVIGPPALRAGSSTPSTPAPPRDVPAPAAAASDTASDAPEPEPVDEPRGA